MAELIQAGEFATEGEQRTALDLRDHLPDDWIIIANKILPQPDGRNAEIDLIILAHRHVFVIDEKSWGGVISGNHQTWICADGRSEPNPLNKMAVIAKKVAGHLRLRIPALADGYFVESGVIFSNPTARLQIINESRASTEIMKLDHAYQILIDRDRERGVQLKPHHHKLRDEFVGLKPRPIIPREIPPYQLDDIHIGRPGVRVFNASLSRQPYRLMVYDLGRDPFQREQLKTFYQREFDALRSLAETGVVAHVEPPLFWGEDQLVIPVRIPGGSPLSLLSPPATRDDFMRELQRARLCFKGLHQIHQSGVVHRALSPGAISVISDKQTKIIFSDFYAARLGEHTIAASLDSLHLNDPYAAPFLASGYGHATPMTDCFSLGLVFFERMSGTPAEHLRVGRQVEMPNLFKRWAALPHTPIERLSQIFERIFGSDPKNAPLSADDIARELDQIVRLLQSDDGQSQGRIFDSRYEVVRLLGQGAMARTYLVIDRDHSSLGAFAVKQYLSPVTVLEQVRAEFDALRKLHSPHVPHIFDLYKPENDIHVKMEYIPGPTLMELEHEFPWPVDRWWEFARQFLDVLETLESRQLLHRDIKPANIMLHEEDGRLVLIDFGFAIAHDKTGASAGTPIYQPPEAHQSDEPPPDSDRYAAAVVLFRALTGELPFEDGDRYRVRTRNSLHHLDARQQRIAAALLSAVDSSPARRPQTLKDWRTQLQQSIHAIPSIEPAQGQRHENMWVSNIRGLYRNSQSGNADNRGLDSNFVRRTYVNTKLDQQLLPYLLDKRPHAVFLCGNPGDGKTAFLEQVRDALLAKGGIEQQRDASGWEITLAQHTYRSCYDASESHNGRSADEQLSARLMSLEGANEPTSAVTVLVAINDGRLRDFLERYQQTFSWIDREIRRAMRHGHSTSHRVWYVDLKQRAFVSFPDAHDESIFRQVLHTLVAPENWAICHSCAAVDVCPIQRNARVLRHSQVAQRLESLLSLTHLRRQRHITMRDLRSALAYIITANQACPDIHQAMEQPDGGASLMRYHYWQSAFATDEQPDDLLRDLSALDPIHVTLPQLDRVLHIWMRPEYEAQRMNVFVPELASDIPRQCFASERDWMDSYKRRMFFEGRADAIAQATWLRLQPYQYAEEFYTLLSGKQHPSTNIRRRLARGIWRSDNVYAELPDDRLGLVISQSEAQRLVVAKEFDLNEFIISVTKPTSADVIETIPETLRFEHRSGTPRLEITLDLYEVLMRLADGLQADLPELRPLHEDLAPFKSSLLLGSANSLVLLESGRYRHRLEQHQGKLRLLTDGDHA